MGLYQTEELDLLLVEDCMLSLWEMILPLPMFEYSREWKACTIADQRLLHFTRLRRDDTGAGIFHLRQVLRIELVGELVAR